MVRKVGSAKKIAVASCAPREKPILRLVRCGMSVLIIHADLRTSAATFSPP
jgi:DNA-binding NarL/FixJ family response regulator